MYLVHRLPNSAYAKDIGIEVKGIAQYHVVSELSAESECQNMMLYSDEKVWMLLHYFWSTKKWWAITCCWDERSWAANAQTELYVLQEVLGKFCYSLENKDEIITSTLINKKKTWGQTSVQSKKNVMIYSLNSEKIFKKMPQKALFHIL